MINSWLTKNAKLRIFFISKSVWQNAWKYRPQRDGWLTRSSSMHFPVYLHNETIIVYAPLPLNAFVVFVFCNSEFQILNYWGTLWWDYVNLSSVSIKPILALTSTVMDRNSRAL